MKKCNSRSNTAVRITSVLLMLLALAWLTVSLPFVNKSYELGKALTEQTQDDDDCNPLRNTNEEKTESGVNSIAEYLHETPEALQHFSVLLAFQKCHPSDLYFAFHPELLSPPPEA